MDKLIEDLLNYICDMTIEIEEIEEAEQTEEEIQEKKEIYFVDNPDRFDMNCKCKTCKFIYLSESASKDPTEVNSEVLPAYQNP